MRAIGQLLLAVVFVAIAASPPRVANAAEWTKLEEDSDAKTGWVLYSRPAKGSDFPEYKIIGLIAAPVSLMSKVAYATLTVPKYVPPKQTRTILEKSETSILNHTLVAMPALFSDRDVVVRIDLFENAGTGVNGYTWQNVHSEGPKPKDGVVRMASSRGSWEFAPAGENQTLATQTTHTDLAGSIPAWLIRSLAEEFVVSSLNNLRKAAAEAGK